MKKPSKTKKLLTVLGLVLVVVAASAAFILNKRNSFDQAYVSNRYNFSLRYPSSAHLTLYDEPKIIGSRILSIDGCGLWAGRPPGIPEDISAKSKIDKVNYSGIEWYRTTMTPSTINAGKAVYFWSYSSDSSTFWFSSNTQNKTLCENVVATFRTGVK